MTDDSLFERFARLRSPQSEGSCRMRRADYKGERRRLNLRVPVQILEELKVVKLAEGIDQNRFCTEVLSRAIRERYDRLKAAEDPARWEVLTSLARKGRG